MTVTTEGSRSCTTPMICWSNELGATLDEGGSGSVDPLGAADRPGDEAFAGAAVVAPLDVREVATAPPEVPPMTTPASRRATGLVPDQRGGAWAGEGTRSAKNAELYRPIG